jgi:hypothetical protein
MPKFTYAPMLRSKAGEATALTNLVNSAKDRTRPVIHLVHKPPATFADAIIAAWAGRHLALDGTFQNAINGNAAGYTHMFDRLGKGKVAIIPSLDYAADAVTLGAIQKLRGKYAPGLMIKVKPNQLHDVTKWVTAQGWKQNEIDLVVWLTEIGGYDPDMLEPVVTKAVIDHIPNPSPWRSIILSASAAPKDHGDLVSGRTNVPRLEWRVWSGVSKSVPYQIDYADFASVHPDLTDPPGYVMARATVSVRYAIDDYWIVIKGKPTSGKSGQPMPVQYRAHAKALVADPAFAGLKTACWADDRIQKIAGGAPGGGSRSVWAGLMANRHLSLVADRLP